MLGEIGKALIRAFGSLLHPRMLLLMVWPVIAALALWITLALLFWTQAAGWIGLQLGQSATYEWVITTWPLALVATHLVWILLALLMIPLVLITAVLIIGVFAMPMMAAHVAERAYPQLARKHGGTFAGSFWNGVAALLILALLAGLSLPLWVFPPLWPVLPVLMFGYFNQRVFRYDAWAEHANGWEMQTLIRRHRKDLFLLGVILALVGHIPLLGFFSPVYGGLTFIHYCLARLAQLREEPVAVQ